jgi:hypothetical protein
MVAFASALPDAAVAGDRHHGGHAVAPLPLPPPQAASNATKTASGNPLPDRMTCFNRIFIGLGTWSGNIV